MSGPSSFDVDLLRDSVGRFGGVRAARVAAGYGARVTIAEEHRVGGTCVIRGCVPKKLMVYASRLRDAFDDADGFGWSMPVAPNFDWAAFCARRDREIARLEGIYRANLDRSGVEIVDNRAWLEGPHTICFAGSRVRARHILVATGARPQEPDFPGSDLTVTSNEIFHLDRLPQRLLVVGAGYIAVEFAGIFHRFGCKVSLIHRGPKLLRSFDDDICDALEQAYATQGIAMSFNCSIVRIDQHPEHLLVTLTNGSTIEVDQVFMATGRVPNTTNLALDAAGIRV